jgi:hypothetical protein
MSTLNHSLSHKRLLHISLLVYAHKDGEDEFWFAWVETAEIIGQYFWKHRDHPSWCIDTCTPLVCFPIDRTAFFHVLRDIGDVDTEKSVSSLVSRDRDGIIEIPSIGSIDRHRIPRSKIKAFMTINANFRKYIMFQ